MSQTTYLKNSSSSKSFVHPFTATSQQIHSLRKLDLLKSDGSRSINKGGDVAKNSVSIYT